MRTFKHILKHVKLAVKECVNIIVFIWIHPANKNKRVRQILKAIRFQLLARISNHRTQATVGSNGKIWVDLHRSSASKALYANPPDWPEMGVWQKTLKPGDLFIDVGANIGSYSILAASLGAQIIAIEPAEDTFALLKENIDLNNFSDAKLICAAAVDYVGEIGFTKGLDSVNQIDPDGAVKVKTVTIDSLIGESIVSGMKIDVEGFELKVLQGAIKALREQRIKLLQLEWNDASLTALGTDRQPVLTLLNQCGYEIYRADTNANLHPESTPEGIRDVFAAPSMRIEPDQFE